MLFGGFDVLKIQKQDKNYQRLYQYQENVPI